ncbi:MAG: Uma2 family endonuclease [Gammaproteobacteria bacterium]|nr:Uma2 family endonuclease [Gammaproteobacteria bacterium]
MFRIPGRQPRFSMTAFPTLRSAHRTKFQRPFTLSGCRPFAMTDTHSIDYEGRYEYWEAGVAWELREPSLRHEWPRSRLAQLIGDIGRMRGAPIALLGTTGLQERDARGTRVRAVQADELVSLDWRYGLPDVFVVGELPLPDVVFEVDLTTDIRDRKLDVYAAWGIPELWVEVPDADMPSKRKRSGLAIFLLDDGTFRESAESAAFPTLSAREIHAALNEPSTSAATVETVRRVGGIMGRRAGTGPDDDPFLSVERQLSRREGQRQGHREGHREGRTFMLEGLLRARGIDITPTSRAEADRIAALPQDRILRAALDSTDSDDFLSRLRP